MEFIVPLSAYAVLSTKAQNNTFLLYGLYKQCTRVTVEQKSLRRMLFDG